MDDTIAGSGVSNGHSWMAVCDRAGSTIGFFLPGHWLYWMRFSTLYFEYPDILLYLLAGAIDLFAV
ncbi:MAG TPA: hypothetical protein VD999_02425 [Vitreimonas sp.]|nr:hypothetical protein [Vitreimonas sp.]